MLRRTMIVVVVGLCLSSIGFGQQSTDWKEFSSTEGRFNAQFPCEPKVESEDVKEGTTTVKQFYNSCIFGSGYFMLSYADFPLQKDPKRFLDTFRDGIINGMGAKLESEKQITMGNHPGREVYSRITTQGIEMNFALRIYLVNNRVYSLGASRLATGDPADVNKFLTSFSLQK